VTLSDFITATLGKTIGGGQCGDLIDAPGVGWLAVLGLSQIFSGTAVGFWTAADPEQFERSPVPISAGDIAVYQEDVAEGIDSAAGHAGIYLDGWTGQGFRALGQNWSSPLHTTIDPYPVGGLLGFLHPKVLDPPPAPPEDSMPREVNLPPVLLEPFDSTLPSEALALEVNTLPGYNRVFASFRNPALPGGATISVLPLLVDDSSPVLAAPPGAEPLVLAPGTSAEWEVPLGLVGHLIVQYVHGGPVWAAAKLSTQ
jgi:hypothetical protein